MCWRGVGFVAVIRAAVIQMDTQSVLAQDMHIWSSKKRPDNSRMKCNAQLVLLSSLSQKEKIRKDKNRVDDLDDFNNCVGSSFANMSGK